MDPHPATATTRVTTPRGDLDFGDVTAWFVETGGTLVLLADDGDVDRQVARIRDWDRVVIVRDR